MSVHNEYTGYTFDAFIAETYVQLVATESMCYSTSGMDKLMVMLSS